MEESTILLDAHIHTAEISPCSRVPAARLVEVCRDDGIDAIVLTNHYKQSAVRGAFADWRQRYADEYERTRVLGEAAGLRVFFGVEFTLNENPHNDYTVYGLTPQDIREADPLFELTLPKLAEYVHARDALLYHAHPFRNTTPADGTLLDGTEINCHPLYRTCEEQRVRAFADRFGLRLSCGSDYHGDTYKPHCGMLVPRTIETTEQLTSYLRETPRPKLVVAPDPKDGVDVAKGALFL